VTEAAVGANGPEQQVRAAFVQREVGNTLRRGLRLPSIQDEKPHSVGQAGLQ
jgi:hypothetical protein